MSNDAFFAFLWRHNIDPNDTLQYDICHNETAQELKAEKYLTSYSV
jgi:hypothetical protein